MGLNGQAAIDWMRAKRTNIPGSCLNTVWQAYGAHSSIGAHAGQYPDAIDGWLYATKRHPNDLNPPSGFPVWYGPSPTRTDDNAGAGDVVISIGNGQIIGTDVGGAGRIGVMSLISRGQIIQRPYLGWTEDFLGYDIDTLNTASLNTTVIGFLMALSDEQQNEVLLLLRNIAGHLYGGGPSAEDPNYLGQPGTIYNIVKKPVHRTINGVETKIDQIQDNADTNTIVRKMYENQTKGNTP
jgi:hypothetical protein